MNRTLLVYLLLTAVSPSPAAEIQSAAVISIDYPVSESDFTPDLEPAMAAKRQGLDYNTPALSAWKKNPKGLDAFLRLSSKLKLDGAYAEIHHEILTHLLLRWGDVDFAKAIPTHDPKVIPDLKRHFAQHIKFQVMFPDTAKALESKN